MSVLRHCRFPKAFSRFSSEFSNNPSKLGLILIPLIFVSFLSSALAQNPAPPRWTPTTALAAIPYDPAQNGVALIVARPGVESTNRKQESLRSVGEAFDRKIVNAGVITVLAPRQMTVINTEPGRAKIFANLEVTDRMKLLLASLTEAQWSIAGSKGIGLGDLTPDQQEIFATFLPPERGFAIQKNEMEAIEGKPNSYNYKKIGDPQPVATSQLRLQLGRKTIYTFSQLGKEDAKAVSHSSSSENTPGAIVNTPVHMRDDGGLTFTGSMENTNDRRSSFGVPIFQSVPSRLKPGQLDYAATALDAPVTLSPDWKTLGDALNAVRDVTGWELYADRRLRDLPLGMRAASNQSVRSGDLLMALAGAVTGTYRRFDEGQNVVFLLTDDVEGIGTRLARLTQWRGAAEQERYDRVDKAVEEAAKANPLPYIKYFPGDDFALPPDLNRRMEDEWSREKYALGIPVKVNELTPKLRRDVEKQAKFWNEDANPPIPVRTDSVLIGSELTFAWRLPNGEKLEDGQAINGYGMSSQFLGRLMRPAPKTASVSSPTPAIATEKKTPRGLPTELKRRAVIISPATTEEARRFVAAGVTRGIREFWVMKTLDDENDAPLKAVIAAAKTKNLPVYVCISALRFGKSGRLEQNILGQTGEEWFLAQKTSSLYRSHPDWWSGSEWQFERWRHWRLPSTTETAAMERRLRTLASIPGVVGVAFKNATPPGYGGEFQGGDGIFPGGYFGYTLPVRLAFLRTQGIDPVDIASDSPYGIRDMDCSLPFFPDAPNGLTVNSNGKTIEVRTPTVEWRDYRYNFATERLKRFHAVLTEANPKLPIFISDLASDYATPYAEWFGLWEAADALPRNPVFSPEGEGRSRARQLHRIVLKRGGWDKASRSAQEPQSFADSIVEKAKTAAKDYDGLAIDISQLAPEDALRLLSALAETPDEKTKKRASSL